MLCTRCKQRATIELRRHHTALCAPHYIEFFRSQVARNIERHRMFSKNDSVLVAVSGGKDSLALWDVLVEAGYQTTGLHIHLGIDSYSDSSRDKTRAFAESRGAKLTEVDVGQEYGLGIPQLGRSIRRVPCSGCGTSKRYIFNRVAREGGFDVIATGHNLDDEAATLMGNVLHWQVDFLARQSPVLEATNPMLAKKVKPLYTLTEREIVAYALLRGIEFKEEECPNAVGASSIQYKEVLNRLEYQSPGTKQQFVEGFFSRVRPLMRDEQAALLHACVHCGEPTTTEVCAFCRMWERALSHTQRRQEPL